MKNEAANIERCLRSVAGVATELVVLDTGSTDATVALAEACARGCSMRRGRTISKARNTAINHATGAWVLVLDADEELGAGWGEVLRARLPVTDAAGFRVVVENLLPADDVARAAEARSVRLFANAPGIATRMRSTSR